MQGRRKRFSCCSELLTGDPESAAISSHFEVGKSLSFAMSRFSLGRVEPAQTLEAGERFVFYFLQTTLDFVDSRR